MSNFFNDARVKFLSKLAGIYVFCQFVFRILLLGISYNDVSYSIKDILGMFVLGIGYDIIIALYLLIPIALFIFLGGKNFLKNCCGKYLRKLLVFAFCFTVIFTAVTEYYFWDEFHSRFNFIAVDYLVYTQELFGNIFQSYNVPALLAGTVVISCILYCFMPDINFACLTGYSWMKKITRVLTYVMVIGLATFCSSSNLKDKLLENHFNQEIAGNGVYQLFYAFFNNELDYNRFYRRMDEKILEQNVREKIALTGEKFTEEHGISRNIVNINANSAKKPNVVLIVVESLSASFTGMDGNTKSLTPNLDKLAKQGFYFGNLYATGTRTVRGLEALSLNIPPTPGQSIVRRPDCNDLYNVGSALRTHGYKTEFIYGGYGYFDNMNEFFSSNGFDVIDRNDIPKEEIVQETIWGVADEVLFTQCLKQLDKHAAKNEPVMQLVMTTTNHRPYTFPEGRIAAPQGKRESVVQYTDWAINNFIERAKQKPWFDDTVFVIIADHNAGVAGKVDLPISKYKIPCVILGSKFIQQGHNDRLMSQIDVMPTLLGMLGVSYDSKNMGYDINKLPIGDERVFISTYQLLGYVKKDMLVILEPRQKARVYKINDYTKNNYSLEKGHEDLIDEAVTWYQGASYLYKNKFFKEK